MPFITKTTVVVWPIKALRESAAAAIVGRALYTGAIDLRQAIARVPAEND